MIVNYEMSDDAISDLHKAQCFFKFVNKENAFMENLLKQLRLVKSMPKAFQIRYRNIRIVQFSKFEYSIHYIVLDDKIRILKIINQRQNF